MTVIPRPQPARRLSLENAVFFTYMLFLAGFYFVPNAVDLYKYYIACVFLPGLLLLPRAGRLAAASRILLLTGAYLLYMLASSLWSESIAPDALWRDTRYVAYILVFLLLTALFFARDPGLRDFCLQVLTLVAGAAAAVAIALFDEAASLPRLTTARLAGIGITENPNPSAFVYGFFGVAALHYARHNARHYGPHYARHYGPHYARRRAERGWQLANAACFVVISLYVVLTQSNTGLLAFIAACALLLLLTGWQSGPRAGGHRTGLLAAGAAAALAAALYLVWSVGLLSGEMDLGFAKRFPIWRHVLESWWQSPVLGGGLQTAVVLDASGTPSTVNYAHSLFLATLRDGGLLGLALLLSVCALALARGLDGARRAQDTLPLALLAYGLVCVLADVDQAITRPRELWIILWLPLGCLAAREVAARREAGAPAR